MYRHTHTHTLKQTHTHTHANKQTNRLTLSMKSMLSTSCAHCHDSVLHLADDQLLFLLLLIASKEEEDAEREWEEGKHEKEEEETREERMRSKCPSETNTESMRTAKTTSMEEAKEGETRATTHHEKEVCRHTSFWGSPKMENFLAARYLLLKKKVLSD